MENNANPIPENASHTKVLVYILVTLVVGVAAYFYLSNQFYPAPEVIENEPVVEHHVAEAEVAHTALAGSLMPAPAGFPAEIPIESVNIVESATTRFPQGAAKQLSLSFKSSQTVAQKYAEYKDYMEKAGYKLAGGDANAKVKTLFGTKAGINLSVAVSAMDGKTLVQISYLTY